VQVACITPAVVGVVQLMPAGEELTDPAAAVAPVALAAFTVRVAEDAVAELDAKVAVTVLAADRATVQVVAVLVQPPVQPTKLLPVAGVAVTRTEVPAL